MPIPVLYPKVSLEMSSGAVSRWLVTEGQSVVAGQILFEIENDKAAMEVESPSNGVIRGLLNEGVEVEVGAAVARILADGESDAASSAPAVKALVAPKVLPSDQTQAVDGSKVASTSSPKPTPLARRIARDREIDLEGLVGTGPRGRVQRDDVLAHLERRLLRENTDNVVAEAVTPVKSGGLNATWLRRGDGLPVVLLHGYSADLNNWRGMFAGARVEVPAFAVDLPAHGASPHDIPSDLDAVAAQVEARLQAEGLEAVVLCGHSFGGALAARIASRAQMDIRGLFLFSPAGLHPQIDQPFIDGILRAREPKSLRPWLEQLVYDPRVISEPIVQATAKARENRDLTDAMTAFRELFFPDGTQSFSIRGDLAQLRIPVRVAFGIHDRILPYDSTRGLPGSVGLHTFDRCGHLPHLEYPDLSLRLVAELWRSVS